MRWCFQCGIQYDEGVADCVECGVELVDEAPTASDEVGTDGEDQLAYELHEWAGESRRLLDQQLTGRSVAHSWQGATLVVRSEDEVLVDELVASTDGTGGPVLDPAAEKIAYEVEGWAADEQTAFTELLGRLGIPHEFDEVGDLLVLAADEDAVESALDAFQGGADERPELEGLAANGLLTDIFVACDRLRRDHHDNRGVEGLVDNAPVLASYRPPFGFDPQMWNALGERSAELAELLATGDTDPDEIKERAKVLAEALRQLV